MPPLHIDIHRTPYRAMIGTGGIGSGMFFALQGNHTLGREESRAGIFLDRRDYCKLHIISHYVKVLLGPEFHTILAGKVGEDAVGQALIDEMKLTGLDVRHVQVCPGCRTLFSVCFTYPDGSGGNLTAADSASDKVDAALISTLEADFIEYTGRGIALAAPEVPLEARLELLTLATRYRFFRAGSFVTAEIPLALQMGLFDRLDLVGLNIDEAAAAAEVGPVQQSVEDIVRAAVGRLAHNYPHLRISVTAGKEGSWSWDGSLLAHRPALQAEVASTAGAGDAHLATLIAGHAAGLSLPQAQQLAGLVASLSVTSPHTIAPEVERDALREFAQRSGITLDDAVWRLVH